MRRSVVVQASSRNICLFCAHKLDVSGATVASSSRNQRRLLRTSERARHSIEAEPQRFSNARQSDAPRFHKTHVASKRSNGDSIARPGLHEEGRRQPGFRVQRPGRPDDGRAAFYRNHSPNTSAIGSVQSQSDKLFASTPGVARRPTRERDDRNAVERRPVAARASEPPPAPARAPWASAPTSNGSTTKQSPQPAKVAFPSFGTSKPASSSATSSGWTKGGGLARATITEDLIRAEKEAAQQAREEKARALEEEARAFEERTRGPPEADRNVRRQAAKDIFQRSPAFPVDSMRQTSRQRDSAVAEQHQNDPFASLPRPSDPGSRGTSEDVVFHSTQGSMRTTDRDVSHLDDRVPDMNHERDVQRPTPFDPKLTANWDIFKKKVAPMQEQSPARKAPTPEDINAKFEEYMKKRQSKQTTADLSNIPQVSSISHHRNEMRKCNACGETGHLAANCPKVTCHHCGKSGHLAAKCPVRAAENRENARKNDAFNPLSGRRPPRAQVQSEQLPARSMDASATATSQPNTAFRRLTFNDNIEENAENETQTKPKFRRSSRNAEDEGMGGQPEARVLRSAKFAEPSEERKGRSHARRGRYDEDDLEEAPRRGRRSRFADEDAEEGEFDGPRSRRRSEFDELDEDVDAEGMRRSRDKRRRNKEARKEKAAKDADRKAARAARKAGDMTPIQLPQFINVSRLAQTLNVTVEDLEAKMEELGFSNTSHDHVLSSENAGLIAMEFNFDASHSGETEKDDRDLRAQPEIEDQEYLPQRPPIVTIMGHVDHGKTTILDYLRKSSVAATEHGGITQHIGAFSVAMSSGKTITFLDTPGHEAFLTMRKRGATVTDIVILVVAADDSVKPQTLEALKHAQGAKVPILVAINKIDKDEANVDRVKQDLARHGVEIEDYGGDTQVVPVSGKTGQGMDELEEAASTLSEILDHRADPTGNVEGWILEATTKPAGRVATVLVRRGTLKPGDILVAGNTWTRVRTLRNEAGVTLMSAGPGTPIEVDGWRDQPAAGDEALQAPTEQKASDVVEYRKEILEQAQLAKDTEAINQSRQLEQEKRERERQKAEAEAKAKANATDEEPSTPTPARPAPSEASETLTHQAVPFIIKADVSGSVEAVTAYLLQMSNPVCSPTLLRSGVGPVSEFDMEHASAADGHIIAFNLPSDPNSMGQAERLGVKILEQNVIYRIVDDVKAVLEQKLPPVKTQRVTGEAEVAMVFEISLGGRKKLKISGCKVRNGMVSRGSRVRVLRGGGGGQKVYDGTVSSLKNVKKDVQEMRKGTECGMGFDGWEDFQENDLIQTYEEKLQKRTLPL